MVCPTGALVEQSAIAAVEAALADPEMFVVVQHAPSISVSIGEELGLPMGTDYCGAMTAGLRRMGFDRVFDTSFSADLTIMEEGSELVDRIKTGKPLPMLTSCSPGWIKFVEHYFPEFIPNVSTCKSPQQMMGAIVKSYYAEKNNIDPKKIFSVSIMPCTAKKFEAARPEMGRSGIPDIDAVLTTRELGVMLRKNGINLATIVPENADSPLKERSSAGKIFGATGGVLEAAIRSLHYLLTGKNLDNLDVKEVRDLKSIKIAKVTINGQVYGVAAVSGLANARKLLNEIKAGRNDLHFIEIMTCPGGCIAGGGQPKGVLKKNITTRMKTLYAIDATDYLRTSHENQEVAQLYREFLVEPLGEKSHHLLHTHYAERKEAL
jgi:iron-only hydrogenase group A